jgi:multiple sugar transport system substrate-binding protein
MVELKLTIMSRQSQDAENLEQLLEVFERRHHVHVRLHLLDWNTAWNEMLNSVFQQKGPDVSEIGTTWLGSLVGMDALSPLSHEETLVLGSPSAFVTSAWQSTTPRSLPMGYGETWAIPLWVDTRILYYRRDLLADAQGRWPPDDGERTAFASHRLLVNTLDRLVESGVPVPLALPTHGSRMIIHHIASWIWGAGGRFLTEGGGRTLFQDPPALTGMCEYFGLERYLTDPARGLDEAESDALYAQGHAALTISGAWLLTAAAPEIVAQTRVVFPPGVPFVGGSHLVCWKHTRHRLLAVKLIQYLASAKVQAAWARQAGLLPTRLDVLSQPPFSNEPIYWLLARGLQRGRSFPGVPLWGLVEERLNEAYSDLWAEILSEPGLDLERTIAARLRPLARELDLTLSHRG